jgi:5-methylcytosine-specific restriction endonuclease McrA
MIQWSMAKTCCIEGCTNRVFGKGYCKYHYPRTPIKHRSEKGKIKADEKKTLIESDKQFYAGIWEKREHYCYECGKGIGEASTANFHHILEKRNYSELRHVEDNIVILCIACHYQVETLLEKCPRTQLLTEELKRRYDSSRDH